MKTRIKLSTINLSLTVALGMALVGAASAQQPRQIGLKMGMNANGNLQYTNVGALAITDSGGAPAYVQTNWNILGRFGDNATNSLGTNAYAILDSYGNDTHVTIMWDATGNFSQAGGGTPTPQNTSDANLMNAFCDSGGNANLPLTNNMNIYGQSGNDKPLVYLQGLQAWLATAGASYYDVVIYSDGDTTAGRTGEYWLQNASLGPTTGPITNLTFGSELTTHAFLCDRANFISTLAYVEEPLYSHGNWVPVVPGFGGGNAGWGAVLGNSPGNYLAFPGLSADSFVLRTEEFRAAGGTLRSPINAIQIVPRLTPLPPTLGPLQPCAVYAGGTATFRALVAGVTPITYRWQTNGVALTDSGRISGSSTATLTITGVRAADAVNYTLIVSNANGTASVTAPLSIVSYVGNSFAEEIVTNNPVAYWRLNDTGDPSTNYAVALDYFGGLNGTYGSAAANGFNGVLGPQPPTFPGFESGHGALQSANGTIRSWVVAPPLMLNTNTVTMCAWVYPTIPTEPASSGILFERTTNNDICGFGIGGTAGNPPNAIGYTWNNNSATFNFASGIAIPSNMWSFVGVVITPSNATLFVYSTNGLFSITNAVTNAIGVFSAPTCIGDDPSSANTPQGRAFTGLICEAAVFNRALPPIEVYSLYKKALHQSALAPAIANQPLPAVLFTGRTAQYTVLASGDPFLALTYQWRKNTGSGPVPLSNGGNISGANTPVLTISNVAAGDVASYDVIVANVVGSATSTAATLAVVAPPASLTPYEAALQALNPAHYWRFNETNGNPYAYDYWGGNIASNNNVIYGTSGPVPPDFVGLESTNAANGYDGNTAFTDTGALLTDHKAAFSICGWFNASGPVGLRVGLFGENDATEFGFHGQDPYAPTGEGQLGIWTPNGGATYLSQTNINPGQWYFAAATGDGANLSLYLFTTNGGGGAQVAFSSTTGSTTNYGSGAGTPFHIGGGGVMDPSGNFFTGYIDEVAVFYRALSMGELSSLFATSIGVSGLPPQITAQPSGRTIYAGQTTTLSVTVLGSAPLSYRWLKNNSAITDTNAVGINTASLTITNLTAANVGDYVLIITNSFGSVTSSVAGLSIISVPAGGYAATVISMNPLAYYRLNETNDPSSGTVIANEYYGGFNGVYAAGALNGFNGILGPQPPGFTFEPNNYAVATGTNVLSSWVTAPFGSLSTNTVTMCMWVMPTGAFNTFAGLLMNRNSGVAGGFGYAGGQLGYTWNNNNASTYNFRSGLVPPSNVWSFVALVVSPTNAILYMYNTNGELSATNVLNHTSDVFGNNWRIGNDDVNNSNDGIRTFTGIIDEVAVFTRSLTAAQLRQLYVSGSVGTPNSLSVQRSGGNIILTWPYGMLIQAPTVNGPWNAVPGNPTSPYTTTPSGTIQFYRVQVQ